MMSLCFYVVGKRAGFALLLSLHKGGSRPHLCLGHSTGRCWALPGCLAEPPSSQSQTLFYRELICTAEEAQMSQHDISHISTVTDLHMQGYRGLAMSLSLHISHVKRHVISVSFCLSRAMQKCHFCLKQI